MPDDRKSPLSAFTENAKAILGLAATVAAAVFGTAHWAFYEQLDVRPSDVGFGPTEILSQAAIGLVLTLLIFAVLTVMLALIYWLGWSTSASWHRDKTRSTPLNGEVALGMGLVGAAAFAAGLVVATFITLAVGAIGLVFVLAGVFGAAALVYVEGWRDRRASTAPSPSRPGMALLAVAGFAVLVVPMAAAVAIDDARAVRRGIVPESLLHPLVGGPVTCVEPKPSQGTATYYLHLGTGDTHEVLYWPGHGPVRVPAGDVVLLPAGASRCRPSP